MRHQEVSKFGWRRRVFVILAFLLHVFCPPVLGQNKTFLSEYVFTSKDLSLELPDSVKNAVRIPANIPVSLKAGQIIYVNTCNSHFARTMISFEASEGFRFSDEQIEVARENDFTNSHYVSIQNDSVIEDISYFMPELISEDKKGDINGYPSHCYSFRNPNGTRYEIWLSDSLPFLVNPGFFFPGKGGVTRIEYTVKNTLWTLDLLRFDEKESQVISTHRHVENESGHRRLFPFFNAK